MILSPYFQTVYDLDQYVTKEELSTGSLPAVCGICPAVRIL